MREIHRAGVHPLAFPGAAPDDRDALFGDVLHRRGTGDRIRHVHEGHHPLPFDQLLDQSLLPGGIRPVISNDVLDRVAADPPLGVPGRSPGLDRLGAWPENGAERAGVVPHGPDLQWRLSARAPGCCRPRRRSPGDLTAARRPRSGGCLGSAVSGRRRGSSSGGPGSLSSRGRSGGASGGGGPRTGGPLPTTPGSSVGTSGGLALPTGLPRQVADTVSGRNRRAVGDRVFPVAPHRCCGCRLNRHTGISLQPLIAQSRPARRQHQDNGGSPSAGRQPGFTAQSARPPLHCSPHGIRSST